MASEDQEPVEKDENEDAFRERLFTAIKQVDPSILDDPGALEIFEEALSISATNPNTHQDNLGRNFDRMWRDLRSIFKLLDKTAVRVAKNGEAHLTAKIAIIAANLEVRRQVKSVQSDMAKFRKDTERELKAIKNGQESLLDQLKKFHKMVGLYMNPPSQMGPLSRRTLKDFKGFEKK